MTVHVRQVVTVDKVVAAVGKYAHVDEKETPVDGEDALLFWINKICSAVRDNLEKIQRRQGGESFNDFWLIEFPLQVLLLNAQLFLRWKTCTKTCAMAPVCALSPHSIVHSCCAQVVRIPMSFSKKYTT